MGSSQRTTSLGWIAALVLLPAVGMAQGERVGEVERLTGAADVTRGGAPAQPLQPAAPIHASDVLRTKSGSELDLELEDGTLVQMGADTRLEMEGYDPDSGREGVLVLRRGQARVQHRKRRSLRMETPTARMEVQGTDFYVDVRPLGETVVLVFEGRVVVSNLGTAAPVQRLLKAGSYTTVRPGEPAAPAAAVEAVAAEEAPAAPEMGSGSQQDTQSGGEQAEDPKAAAPEVPQPVMVPPELSPPPVVAPGGGGEGGSR